MDFKHKGITWVGNMYQKFEAVCQEVDNIINQDTVKYVENQVHSASENVKKIYSDVVQGFLPPPVDPVKYEAKGVAQRERAPTNAHFNSLTHNEGNAVNNVTNKSSVGHGTNDLIDKHSLASCKVTFVNEEVTVAQVPNHSLLELNADIPLGKNDDVFLDKDLDENMKENAINELLSEKSDGTLTDKHAFMEPDADDPLSNPLRNVRSEINHTNKRAYLVCDDSDMQLEDDTLLGNNEGVLTDKDANKSSERDATMEFNASDLLKHEPNCASCVVKVIDEDAILVLDDSHISLESSRLSRENDGDLTDEDSDECSKKVATMKPDASDLVNNDHLSHVWSGSNFISKETTQVSDDSHFLYESEVLSGKIDDPLTDKGFDKSHIKDAIFMHDPHSYLLNLPSQACSRVGFTNKEAIMVSDSNHLQLESELLSGKNDDVLTDKYSNESLKKDTILEHDASYPLKNQPGCTSSGINYKNEEVTSVSNDLFQRLESEFSWGNNSEALIDKEADGSFEEQTNSEFSTELISYCDEGSVKETLCGCDNEFEEDIVTSTGDPSEKDIVTSTGDHSETSIHGLDAESTHKVGQTSSILANNLVNFSPKMEITSDYFANGTSYSSDAPEATSELVSPVLTCGKIVEEMRPVSSLKVPLEEPFFASRSLVKNLFSGSAVHDKPADQRVSADCETRPSFEVVTSASYENKALEMKLASSRSYSLLMQPLEDHASRAFPPDFCTSSHVQFSKSTGPEALIFTTEIGCPYNSSGYIPDAEMETVDLKHKTAFEDGCDIVDCRALHAVSRRTQKLRSYKKRIQDAFNSKKRLAKEYEQLAIWYGDIDLEYSTDGPQTLDTKNSSASYASDSEWELL